jgi:hypothetical protein
MENQQQSTVLTIMQGEGERGYYNINKVTGIVSMRMESITINRPHIRNGRW